MWLNAGPVGELVAVAAELGLSEVRVEDHLGAPPGRLADDRGGRGERRATRRELVPSDQDAPVVLDPRQELVGQA